MRSGLPAVLALACLLGSVPARAAGELNGRQTIPYSQLNSLAGGGEVAWPEAAPALEKPGVVARALGAASAQAATSEAGAATQAQGAPGQDLGGRGIMDSRQSLRGKVNAGGPEDWPEDSGLSTTTADVPQGGAPAQAPAPQAAPQAPAATPATPESAPQAPTPAPQPTAPQPSAGQNTTPAPAQIPANAPASAPAAAPTAPEGHAPAAAVPAAPAQQPEAPAVRHEGR
ncbi:MAG: hypothetical protein HDQ90_08740, partial [Desulfovibrio sp.]|nr:hypothetical protein [Desulfovibrio sp.]